MGPSRHESADSVPVLSPQGGALTLSDVLAALAGAGLPDDALRAAVAALMRTAAVAPASAAAPRLVEGA